MTHILSIFILFSHFFFFFFNDTATTEIYTLSLHDALPISLSERHGARAAQFRPFLVRVEDIDQRDVHHEGLDRIERRSEEHTSELQSQSNLVCRLLLEKKKYINYICNCTDCKRLIMRDFCV